MLSYKTGKMKKIFIFIFALAVVLLSACKQDEPVIPVVTAPISFGEMTDMRDGEVYKTIIVGDQEWMAENLRYRIPLGPIDGCYTYGEQSIVFSNLEVDKADFVDSVYAAIDRQEIVDPEGLPAMQRPTVIISLNINIVKPMALIDALVVYPDVHAVLTRIHENLLAPAKEQQVKHNYIKAEQENGAYSKEYGMLYTFEAAQDVAPEGWRLPTDEDWKILEENLGIPKEELDKLESWRGTVAERFLDNPETGVGFNAKLGGGRVYGIFMYGTPFLNKEVNGYYWSSSEFEANDSTTLGISRNFVRGNAGVWRGTAKKSSAYHIKCIKIK